MTFPKAYANRIRAVDASIIGRMDDLSSSLYGLSGESVGMGEENTECFSSRPAENPVDQFGFWSLLLF